MTGGKAKTTDEQGIEMASGQGSREHVVSADEWRNVAISNCRTHAAARRVGLHCVHFISCSIEPQRCFGRGYVRRMAPQNLLQSVRWPCVSARNDFSQDPKGQGKISIVP